MRIPNVLVSDSGETICELIASVMSLHNLWSIQIDYSDDKADASLALPHRLQLTFTFEDGTALRVNCMAATRGALAVRMHDLTILPTGAQMTGRATRTAG